MPNLKQIKERIIRHFVFFNQKGIIKNMEEIKKHLSNESLIIKEVNIGLYEDTTYYSGQGFSNEFNDERNKENYFVEDNDSINIHKEENEEISEEISNVNLLA